MNYTVKQLAKLSGVSIRTLHYYDEIGLLNPAYISESGYRYYTQKELLLLQQILFFKELGFELKQIQAILQQGERDRMAALQSQKKLLHDKIAKLHTLIGTIDSTIEFIEGKQMQESTLFKGFEPDSEQQKRYEQYVHEYLKKKYGKDVQQTLARGFKDTKDWKQQEWQMAGKELNILCQELLTLMRQQYAPESEEVQHVIGRHYAWLQQFWAPTMTSYKGHADFIRETELKQFYDRYDPHLAQFVADAIKAFVQRNT